MLGGEVFLIILGLIWIVFAVVQDIKKREIANWLNFSLIIFALGFRFFFSLFSQEGGFNFFYQGLLGLLIFFVVGNLFYYGRIFAGGDAKLMIAMGTILPISGSFTPNLHLFLEFLLFFLISGAVYGIVFGGALAVKKRKYFVKEFSNQIKKNKGILYSLLFSGILLLFLAFINPLFFYFAVLVFISPYIYFSAKAIDESCMVKEVSTKLLTEGDWLYLDIRIGNKIIKSKWGGLSFDEILFLRKHKKKVKIREGIPFSPVFLISYVLILVFYFLFGGIKVFF